MSKFIGGAVLAGLSLTLLGAGCNIVTGPGSSSGAVVRLPAKTVTVQSPASTKVRPLTISPIQIVPVVEDYLSDHLVKQQSGGKIFSSFYVYAEEERDDELYYYLWAVVREYIKRGTSVQTTNGASQPLIVVLAKNLDGVYNRVLGYREARSYSELEAVRELFPQAAVQTITASPTDHARRLDLLERETLTKAREFYALGDPVNIAEIERQKCTNYSFEDFVDLTPFTGTPRQFVTPAFARGNAKIQEALTSALTYGFAGRFGIASWSCGTNCTQHAVVDPANGTIVGRPFRGDYGVDYRQNSRLLVVNPYRNILKPNIKVTTSYLLVKDGNSPSLSTLCAYTPPATTASPLFIDSGGSDSSARRYFSSNPNECLSLRVECTLDERYFSDDSGCGCESGSTIQ